MIYYNPISHGILCLHLFIYLFRFVLMEVNVDTISRPVQKKKPKSHYLKAKYEKTMQGTEFSRLEKNYAY